MPIYMVRMFATTTMLETKPFCFIYNLSLLLIFFPSRLYCKATCCGIGSNLKCSSVSGGKCSHHFPTRTLYLVLTAGFHRAGHTPQLLCQSDTVSRPTSYCLLHYSQIMYPNSILTLRGKEFSYFSMCHRSLKYSGRDIALSLIVACHIVTYCSLSHCGIVTYSHLSQCHIVTYSSLSHHCHLKSLITLSHCHI